MQIRPGAVAHNVLGQQVLAAISLQGTGHLSGVLMTQFGSCLKTWKHLLNALMHVSAFCQHVTANLGTCGLYLQSKREEWVCPATQQRTNAGADLQSWVYICLVSYFTYQFSALKSLPIERSFNLVYFFKLYSFCYVHNVIKMCPSYFDEFWILLY